MKLASIRQLHQHTQKTNMAASNEENTFKIVSVRQHLFYAEPKDKSFVYNVALKVAIKYVLPFIAFCSPPRARITDTKCLNFDHPEDVLEYELLTPNLGVKTCC